MQLGQDSNLEAVEVLIEETKYVLWELQGEIAEMQQFLITLGAIDQPDPAEIYHDLDFQQAKFEHDFTKGILKVSKNLSFINVCFSILITQMTNWAEQS